jgi:branched-chain amino acid transport system substrate-binding protein
MRRRRLALTCATAVAAIAATGCGSGAKTATDPRPDSLTVYSSLPLKGPGSERSRDVLDGEQLAMGATGGVVGPFALRLRSLDDTAPDGRWKPDATVDAAELAAKDPTTIAYLGDFDAAATALSLPLTNAVGALQVSPGATYDGFSGGIGKGPGEPEKYRPTGIGTFSRMAPADAVQARAIVDLLREQGCQRLAVLRAPSAFDASLAQLIGTAAKHRGIRVVYFDQVRLDPDARLDAARDVVEADADCATFAATLDDAPAALLTQLHQVDPQLRIVLPLALADDELARQLGAAAAVTTIVGPPQPTPAFTARFTRQFGRAPGPWAPYGHDAMLRVVQAIERAGEDGNERASVVDEYLALPDPQDRLGLWTPTPAGLRFDREIAAT